MKRPVKKDNKKKSTTKHNPVKNNIKVDAINRNKKAIKEKKGLESNIVKEIKKSNVSPTQEKIKRRKQFLCKKKNQRCNTNESLRSFQRKLRKAVHGLKNALLTVPQINKNYNSETRLNEDVTNDRLNVEISTNNLEKAETN